jgi:hypothetical protein
LRARLGSAARTRFEASFTRAHFAAAYLEQVRAIVAARAAKPARGHLGAREGPGELPSAYRVPMDTVLSAEGPALEQVPFLGCHA